MHIRRLAANVYDVFLGKGWNNWTRVRRNNRGVHIIDGQPLGPFIIKELKARLK
jgi:hypothetical protein